MACNRRLARAAGICLALGVLCRPALAAAQQCYPNLPAPSLAVVGTEDYISNGQAWTRFLLNVTNSAAFPDELFAAAPTLPPCGLNTNSSRTWVQIYDGADAYIYGFCGLRQSESLNSTWFAIPRSAPRPAAVYMTLNDRQCGLTYTSNEVSLVPEAPTTLRATSVAGNQVSLRWTPPAGGPVPTGYVVEGGVSPGEALGSLQTSDANPVFTFAAPTGAFYVRVHSMFGSARSAASNEIRIFVNTSAPPSAPANLLGLVDGSTLALAWTNTYAGGAPESLALDVTGSIVTSLPLGLGEGFSFVGVPGGTYTLALRALNAGGTSPPSNAVTLSFPGPCSGPPVAPTNVLAYRTSNTVSVDWEPGATGPAPTGYVLYVTGSFVGSFATTGRAMSGTVAAGTYTLSVAATNACGTSPGSPPQTVVVP